MNRRQQGFTLIEVLVAVSISAILLVSIYGVFTSMSSAKTRLETEGEGYHLARVIFDRIGREIRGSFEDRQSPETRMSGGLDEHGTPFLALATTAGTPRQGESPGIVLVRYEVRRETDGDKDELALMRSEQPATAGDAAPPAYRLAGGLDTLQLRFLADGEWREQWPFDGAGGPPQAVELTLAVRVDGRVIPFRSSFEVPPIGVN